jgi:acyl-CoA thioester hydrolase
VIQFPFVHRETVRFRDLDSLGHVNNAVYLTYLEQARIAFLAPHAADYSGMILARCEIDFRAQVSLGETVEIELTPTRVGNKSFELSYEMKVGDRLVAEAKTVLVAYDYERSESRVIPDAWRKLLAT